MNISQSKDKKKRLGLFLTIFVFFSLVLSAATGSPRDFSLQPIAYAETIPLNPNSTPINWEDFSYGFIRDTGGGCGGEAVTFNSSLFFNRDQICYHTANFQQVLSFHVVGPYLYLDQPFIDVQWSNTARTIKATGFISTTDASTSASFTPDISWEGGGSGSHDEIATPITLTYPFDLTFAYDGIAVTILANNEVLEKMYVDVVVADKTYITAREIQIGGLKQLVSYGDSEASKYVTCSILDLSCNIHNAELWVENQLIPDPEGFHTQWNRLTAGLNTHALFGYPTAILYFDPAELDIPSTTTPDIVIHSPSLTMPNGLASVAVPDFTFHIDASTSAFLTNMRPWEMIMMDLSYIVFITDMAFFVF